MCIFKVASEAAQRRYQEEIEHAAKGRKVDKARVERRKNELYHERLVRACLGVSNNAELNNPAFALAAAAPEVLLTKMHYLGWGDARKQKHSNDTSPDLLKEYSESFGSDYKLSETPKIIENILDGNIDKTLICHGLSPISDTILLLADLGRSIRISHALGIDEIEILLADISWIKHNRSISQLFDKHEFIDELRVCLDKRVRLYKALGLKHKIFGISDFDNTGDSIGKKGLNSAATQYRELAVSIWGESVLKKQDSNLKALIGSSFNGLNKKNQNMLPEHMKILVSFDKFCKSFESSLTDELTILRTLSDLFSTFDKDIFIYYFAQYFAQRKYNNYVKIAPYSEVKFDSPFDKNEKHFNAFINNSESSGPERVTYNLYLPQYTLGKYQLLPYTSTSGDVLRNSVKISDFIHGTILINDSYHAQKDKIIGVIADTGLAHRNRLISDLLSFIHVMKCKASVDESIFDDIKIYLNDLDPRFVEQIFSQEDIEAYKDIFSNAIKAISSNEFVIPSHLIPYTWDGDDWTTDRIVTCANMIMSLLNIVNEICE